VAQRSTQPNTEPQEGVGMGNLLEKAKNGRPYVIQHLLTAAGLFILISSSGLVDWGYLSLSSIVWAVIALLSISTIFLMKQKNV